MRTKHREDQMPQAQRAHGSLSHGRLDQGLRSKGREDPREAGTHPQGQRQRGRDTQKQRLEMHVWGETKTVREMDRREETEKEARRE